MNNSLLTINRIKALLDTNIWLSTVTHDLLLVPKTVKWGEIFVTADVATEQPRKLRNKTQEKSDAIYDALKAIAVMSKEGRVILYRSNETQFEEMHLRRPSLRGTELDAFSGIDVEFVHGPLRRDFTITAHSSREELKGEWYEFLGNIRHPRFLELRTAIPAKKHTADLYHIWTAEHNSLDCYITLDQKFVNAVALPKPIETSVIVCTPTEFLKWAASRP